MIHRIFSIYDSKVEAYLLPIFMQTKAAAIRAVSDTMRDPQHTFAMHAEDYTLFYLGSFDDSNAGWDLEATAISLGVLIELKPTERA